VLKKFVFFAGGGGGFTKFGVGVLCKERGLRKKNRLSDRSTFLMGVNKFPTVPSVFIIKRFKLNSVQSVPKPRR
jgi:hypothetical protein